MNLKILFTLLLQLIFPKNLTRLMTILVVILVVILCSFMIVTCSTDDNDGVNNDEDAFPQDACASVDSDNDGFPDSIVDSCETDLTVDAFPQDACASVDSDNDGFPDSIVDSCETDLTVDMDSDNDGVNNDTDNCEFVANSGQIDANNNGIGDVCDLPAVTDVSGVVGIGTDGTNVNLTLSWTNSIVSNFFVEQTQTRITWTLDGGVTSASPAVVLVTDGTIVP